MMTILWTFETREKLDRFAAILGESDIGYEIEGGGGGTARGPGGPAKILVDESDYEKARRILMRHRKRRTSSDYH